MKPQTYMNRSGESVAEACRGLNLPPARLVVVYDDVDLPLGRIRVRREGGSGGHRGVQSIITQAGASAFPRVRIGVGRPPHEVAVDEYVLAPFATAEQDAVQEAIRRASEAVCAIVTHGVDSAMQRFNAPASGDAETSGAGE